MKRLLDTNVWIALSVDRHKHYAAASEFHDAAQEVGPLLFCRATEAAFLRLMTHERIMRGMNVEPLSNRAAVELLLRLRSRPHVSHIDEAPDTGRIWLDIAGVPYPATNIWNDAYLAALAISTGAELVSFDAGFREYVGKGLQLNLLAAS